MKTFEKVLFLVGFICLSICTARHFYRLWLEPRTSVLDEFKDPTTKDINKAKSLKELVNKYRIVKREADYQRQMIDEVIKKKLDNLPDETKDVSAISKRALLSLEREPFKSEDELRTAINEWEDKTHQIYELRIYCLFGFLYTLLGILVHRKRSEWLGLAMLVTGFSELVYWASPSFFRSNSIEFDKLLLNKLVFSFAALLVLLTMGYFLGLMKRNETSS